MSDLIAPTLGGPLRPRMSSVPVPKPVSPIPEPDQPGVVDPDPLSPEPTNPVQEPPDEVDVPTRLPGHPGQPMRMRTTRSRCTMRHEHAGA